MLSYVRSPKPDLGNNFSVQTFPYVGLQNPWILRSDMEGENRLKIGRSWDGFRVEFEWFWDGFGSPTWRDFGLLGPPKLISAKSRFFKDVSSETLFFDFMLRPKIRKNRCGMG